MWRRRGPMALALASMCLTLSALAAGCAPEPRTVHCSNDADCTELGGDFHYCAQSRCVECVTSAWCGPDRRCAAGSWVPQ
jgi:hypothetical protein